jgi:phage I-like protein
VIQRRLAFLDASPAASDSIAAAAVALSDQGEAAPNPTLTADGKYVVGKPFRVFPYGTIDTEKGPFTFDAAAARRVQASREKRGTKVPIDYEHGFAKAVQGEARPGDPIKVAGYCKLEARDDGLWAVDVDWTKEAFSKIRDGEYRYHSPFFTRDGKKIDEVLNIALTIDPAMHGTSQRVTASAIPYAAHPVVDGAWDADAAEHLLRKWASKDGSGDTGTIDFRKFGEGFAYVADGGDKIGDYKLPHHDVRDGKLVTVRAGVQAAGNAIQGGRGGVDIPAGDLGAVKKHLEQHYHQFDAKAPWENQETSSLSATDKEKTMKNKLAKYLSGRMDEHELEPKELAGKMGFDHDRLMKFAKGEEKPGEEEMKRLAKGLGCKFSHLCKLAEEHDDDAEKEEKLAAEKAEKEKNEKLAAEKLAAEKLAAEKAEKEKLAAEAKGNMEKLVTLANSVPDPVTKGLLLGLVQQNQTLAETLSTMAEKQKTLDVSLAAMEKDRQTVALSTMIDGALRDGRITPAQRETFTEMGRKNGLEVLSTCLSVLIPRGPGVDPVTQRSQLTGSTETEPAMPPDRFFEELARSLPSGKTVEQLKAQHKERLEQEKKANLAALSSLGRN